MRNRNKIEEKLAKRNLIRKANRKTGRQIKQADVTLVRKMVAHALVPKTTQETTTATITQQYDLSSQKCGKALLKSISKHAPVSKAELLKTFNSARRSY